MSEYDKDDFEKDFMLRTLEILKDYEGPYDATLLMNCLLGLVVIPKEKLLDKLPDDSIDKIGEWGIDQDSIRDIGRESKENSDPNTIRGVVINLRHSIAHSLFDPVAVGREVTAFDFITNDSGFQAKLTLQEIAEFVRKLCNHLNNQQSNLKDD